MTQRFAEVEQPPEDVATDVSTVKEFLLRYYKPDRLNSMPGRLERMIAYYSAELTTAGKCWISRHDSVTGNAVEYSGPA